jgi:hypothetical protein
MVRWLNNRPGFLGLDRVLRSITNTLNEPLRLNDWERPVN